ncbi:MAG: lysophospholipid acyltransferase family protein [Eubacteriales bacterium]|nr:lysophospholipid acyltransferase family protein [Eubacteriales bacterium]MDD4327508.1 lysophospholipid acyltransferase family protein [Eubacteriales bacterium]MDD4717470.1 lysophospholipid acyltransferase family protein [Eubacteriales bacterium]NCU25295.1 1-acyl-sn-glycerol-3-phosphate acyltransferase [Candidatus Nomurabacteria bacterium]
MKGSTRHFVVNKLARVILLPAMKLKFRFKFDRIRPAGKPYIVVSNHVCNYDPILVGLSFKDVLYYVASDHLFRMGLISKLLVFAISPIPRAKATTETKTVKEIFSRLKDGRNICIFAEGNSTFSGETGYIPPSIGKLAKRAGASLITYRLKGGYFSMPRWSHNVRKGFLKGELVREYTPEQLADMSDDEMNEAVRRDLYVNAFDDQEVSPVAFRGKRLAEFLEHVLYCCPKCFSFSKLASKDDRLSCECGMEARYTEYGYLEPYSSDSWSLPFTKITEWVKWQQTVLEKRAKELIENCTLPIFAEDGQILIEAVRGRRNNIVSKGVLKFYCDRFTISGIDGIERVFMLTDIVNMSVITQMNLVFSTKEGTTYELHSDHPRSATKYLDLYRDLTGKPVSV